MTKIENGVVVCSLGFVSLCVGNDNSPCPVILTLCFLNKPCSTTIQTVKDHAKWQCEKIRISTVCSIACKCDTSII